MSAKLQAGKLQVCRRSILVTGQVQGVGFRPFVYRTALKWGLAGSVGNTPQGVLINVRGAIEGIEGLLHALKHELPPLARVTSVVVTETPDSVDDVAGEFFGEKEADALPVFTIVPSVGEHGHAVLVSPDTATCAACVRELFDPADRRYLYPFINCTDCGPRYTLTRSIPYDRATTSMACFPLCSQCHAEYTNPLERRFHAQPNACPVCGPKVWTVWNPDASASGQLAVSSSEDGSLPPVPLCAKPLDEAAQALAHGYIAAIKGLGGFHLVCDACNDQALALLRQRKKRPHQSLAIMVPDVGTAREVACLTLEDEAALTSKERPIVIVRRRGGEVLSALIAPELDTVGLMLPYTPLHHVLLYLFARRSAGPAALVMTSGNAGGEPLCLGNREALSRLGPLADLFVFHNRDILVRADDSVVRTLPQQFFRRARGFVPSPLPLPQPVVSSSLPDILAVGAELKNTVCVTRGTDAFVSQHIGDLRHLQVSTFFEEVIGHVSRLLDVHPGVVVCDEHPDYHSTSYALDAGLPVLRLQHHFAHIHSVLAENGHTDPALGLALDGSGLGTSDCVDEDGPCAPIWGGELLYVHPARAGEAGSHARLGCLSPLPLPGGDMAVAEPWRLVAGLEAMGVLGDQAMPWPWLPHKRDLHETVGEVSRTGRTLYASSCGRLFDAVAAALGLCETVSYEGQAAIRLEQAQDMSDATPFAAPLLRRGAFVELDGLCLFRQTVELAYGAALASGALRLTSARVGLAARRFHLGLIQGLADLVLAGAEKSGVRVVALSGGVMHNQTLALALPMALRERGLTPLLHKVLPPGDGGISYGQASWARLVLANRTSAFSR